MRINRSSGKQWLVATAFMMVVAGAPLLTEASTYGSGSYNVGSYNGDSIVIGPVTLPNTGATWVALGAAGGLGLLGAVTVWRRARRSN